METFRLPELWAQSLLPVVQGRGGETEGDRTVGKPFRRRLTGGAHWVWVTSCRPLIP